MCDHPLEFALCERVNACISIWHLILERQSSSPKGLLFIDLPLPQPKKIIIFLQCQEEFGLACKNKRHFHICIRLSAVCKRSEHVGPERFCLKRQGHATVDKHLLEKTEHVIFQTSDFSVIPIRNSDDVKSWISRNIYHSDVMLVSINRSPLTAHVSNRGTSVVSYPTLSTPA